MTTIGEVLAPFGLPNQEKIEAALMAREDSMADTLRLAGIQFGLYPQIVAHVLADVGLGTPPSDEARTLIRREFENLMEELQRQYREGGGGVQ